MRLGITSMKLPSNILALADSPCILRSSFVEYRVLSIRSIISTVSTCSHFVVSEDFLTETQVGKNEAQVGKNATQVGKIGPQVDRIGRQVGAKWGEKNQKSIVFNT